MKAKARKIDDKLILFCNPELIVQYDFDTNKKKNVLL